MPISPQRQILTVSALNEQVRDLLENRFPQIWVEGEISNLSRPSSGHLYFTLKDPGGQISAAMFRGNNRFLGFNPKDGMQVLVRAKLSLYPARGSYQLIVDQMEEAGLGALRRAFDALRLKLQAEGLFDAERKRPLPKHIRHLAVITSPSGAAIQDIISVLGRRFPGLAVTVIPSPVQGKEAPAALIHALQLANQHPDFDVVLLARGGGSLEDLWAFNDEGLARTIAESRLPVISGVGHETDFTIADFVADIRAPTPSAAAELLSQDAIFMAGVIRGFQQRLTRAMQGRLQQQQQKLQHLQARLRHPGQRLQDSMQRLDNLDIRLQQAALRLLTTQQQRVASLTQRLYAQHPAQRIRQAAQRLDNLQQRLQREQQRTLQHAKQQLQTLVQRLHAQQPGQRIIPLQERTTMLETRLQRAMLQELKNHKVRLQHLAERAQLASPLAILSRGYAVIESEKGILRSVTQIETGDTVQARLSDGTISATVTAIRNH